MPLRRYAGGLQLRLEPDDLTVCRLDPTDPIPAWAVDAMPLHLSRTATELSIVCPAARVPADVRAERHWQAIAIVGTLDFSLVGILASITTPLAEAGVSLFAISTYDTDYVLVRAADVSRAHAALTAAGHVWA
jgi:uncharacterized protein